MMRDDVDDCLVGSSVGGAATLILAVSPLVIYLSRLLLTWGLVRKVSSSGGRVEIARINGSIYLKFSSPDEPGSRRPDAEYDNSTSNLVPTAELAGAVLPDSADVQPRVVTLI
jgi:hypothetical protein